MADGFGQNLNKIPNILQEITKAMVSLYVEKAIISDFQWVVKFNEFRDNLSGYAKQYLEKVLPTFSDVCRTFAELFEQYEDIDYITWKENMSKTIDRVAGCEKAIFQLADTHENMKGGLKALHSNLTDFKETLEALLSEFTLKELQPDKSNVRKSWKFWSKSSNEENVQESEAEYTKEELNQWKETLQFVEEKILNNISKLVEIISDLKKRISRVADDLSSPSKYSSCKEDSPVARDEDACSEIVATEYQQAHRLAQAMPLPNDEVCTTRTKQQDLDKHFLYMKSQTASFRESHLQIKATLPIIRSNIRVLP